VTDTPSDFDGTPYDPASMAASSLGTMKAVWYKRPWFLVTAVIVAVVAVSVITDLPQHVSKAQDASYQNASLKEINNDLAPCSYAIKQAFSFYDQRAARTLALSNYAVARTYLTEDQVACSFAGAPVSDLTNVLQITQTTAGAHVYTMYSSVVRWMTSDADASIADILYLFNHPGDQKHLRDLSKQERYLTKDRTDALNDLAQASKILGIQLTPLKLPVLAQLPGT
jgi:hypothetical protein